MKANDKIFSIQNLSPMLDKERKAGKKIVMCHGVFDLLHAGHIFHFKAAKQLGDILVVSLTPDQYVNKGPNRPHFNQNMRLQNIAELESVDYVVLNEWPTSIETLQALKPHVYAKGKDYAKAKDDVTGNIKKEEDSVNSVGGKLVFTDEPTLSSSNLLNELFPSYSKEAQDFLKAFKKKYTLEQVYEFLDNLNDLKVLIVGESIMDRYTYCVPLAKSTKETIIATKYTSEESFLGGSLTIANHVSNFCKKVTLVTNLGPEEDINTFISDKLNPNVKIKNLRVPGRPTILKRRFVEQSFLNKMFEIQYLDDSPIPPKYEDKLITLIQEQAPKHDLVIIADYGHGLINDKTVTTLSNLEQFVCVNTQTNSANLGFNLITKYKNADYICIDEPELKFAADSRYLSIEEMMNKIQTKVGFSNLMVSRGAKGTIFFEKDGTPRVTPVFSSNVVDRIGAGDTVFSITSPLLYARCPSDVIGLIANCAGALAVKTLCNRKQINPPDLKKFIKVLMA